MASVSLAGDGVATNSWLSRALARANNSQCAGPAEATFTQELCHTTRSLSTCGHVESSRIDQQLALLLSVDLGQLGKSDIVTNPQANLAPGGGERGELVPRAQGIRLLERHLTGDI